MAKLDETTEINNTETTKVMKDKHYEKEESISYGYGVRHVQMLVVCVSLCVLVISRAYIAVTIVAMTDVPRSAELVTDLHIDFKENMNATDINDTPTMDEVIAQWQKQNNQTKNRGMITVVNAADAVVNAADSNNSSLWNVYRVYAWPKSIQEMVLSAFYLGYMIMMTPMGLVCQRWGGKLPLQIGLFTSGIITVITPWLAVWGDWKAVCLSRVAMGLTQAGTYPSIHTLLAKWVPASELGRLATYVYTGSTVGSILSSHMSGVLASCRLGWPAVCWSVGALCLLAGLLLSWLVAPSPHHHRSISHQEQTFILGGIKDQEEKRYKTPWKAIVTSKHVWACFFTHFGTSATYFFFFAQIPTYLHYVVGLDIKSSGLLSSLPYLANLLMSICVGTLNDYCINHKLMSKKTVRIISNCIASVGPAVGLFSLSYITDPALAVSCIVFCLGTHAGINTGWLVNYIDLAPNFSGSLMATGNTVMNIGALLLPVLVANVVIDMTNVHQWRIVLFVVGTVVLITNALFVAMMTTDLQPWNDAAYTTTGSEDPDSKEHKKGEQNKAQ